MTLTGLDQIEQNGLSLPGLGKIALLCNATTTNRKWLGTAEVLSAIKGVKLVRILSPQHGFASDKQDNMIESDHGRHDRLDLPVVSLYSDSRMPSREALTDIDAIVIDLQDIGTRVYTFLTTALMTIQAAVKESLPVIVLDRPNPIGPLMAGPVLSSKFHSFVGYTDIPLQHGLTLGEICLYGAWRLNLIPGDKITHKGSTEAVSDYTSGTGSIRVIKMSTWSHSISFDQTGLPWTMPSPNMPTPETAAVYPGQVALEGTNLSEGRGTTRPFELFGAPYIQPQEILSVLADAGYLRTGALGGVGYGLPGSPLAGAVLRETHFMPTFQKYTAKLCHGFQLHVIQQSDFRPVSCTLALLWAVNRACPEDFSWRQPPYEYEETLLPIDLIFGTDRVRLALAAGDTPEKIINSWEDDLLAFKQRVLSFMLYEV